MFLSSYEALISGELKKEMLTAEDMYQDKTGKRLGLGKAGFDKSKLRCYNCKSLGHFKRECPLLKEGNTEAAPAIKPIAIEENKNSVTPNTPKALVVEDYDWGEEIAEAKEQVNKALMAKISSGSSSKQVEKQAAGIPKGDNIADKGLKSILTSPEPEQNKNPEEAEKSKEQIPKELPDEKKEKGKASVAAMKTESSKEKADKDLREKDKALKFNKELKQNEAAYQRKLNSTLAEMQTLKNLGHVPTFETRDREHAMFECHDLNSAFCDDKNVCESPVFVPELKKNSFGKFLTEEIPEFIPSRTGMTDSKKKVTEDSSKEDSSFSASEKEEETSSSDEEQESENSSEDQTTEDQSSKDSSDEASEDQNSENSSEYQTSESSSHSDNDEDCLEDESRVDKKMKKAESS
ncbi:lisH domain-containing protein C1711.05-like [Helianthus annuus]|uniref:lisH domain-containing protein C1711.05-like n=1 Tax=Helianthus annuus TaxID=4232 RepID=UPI001652D699|nr:lisH domain-containing protein C1711.05-like [Helianthus annuus]